ncbi:MAG: DMT family transporter [Solirubrobacteraceae bacterium]
MFVWYGHHRTPPAAQTTPSAALESSGDGKGMGVDCGGVAALGQLVPADQGRRDPIFVAVLAVWFDASGRVRGIRPAGLAIGIAGVAVLLGLDLSGEAAELAGAGMVLLASLCFAVAALFYKRSFEEAEPMGVVFATLAIAPVLVAPAALATLPSELPSFKANSALVVLGLANTGVGFWLFYALIDRTDAGGASLITYVIPAVATLLGVGVATG